MRRQLRAITIAATATVITLAWTSAAAAAGPPFELSVKRDRLVGGSRGTLVFAMDRIEYRTTDTDDARRWAYDQVNQLQILSPTRIVVRTYEDRGLLRLGADRTFDFTVIDSTVGPALVRFLLDRVSRPVVTAVMPPLSGERLFGALVKHHRQGRGAEGVLVMYDTQLVYLTEEEEDSRYWRFTDIFSVLRLDRYRLQITVYEGGGGSTRTFVFELKSDLPDGFYDALWARVNPPALERTPPSTAGLPALAGS